MKIEKTIKRRYIQVPKMMPLIPLIERHSDARCERPQKHQAIDERRVVAASSWAHVGDMQRSMVSSDLPLPAGQNLP
jgi:hypothetical protein